METTTQTQTSKEYFKSLKILHIAFILGQIIFGLVIYSWISGTIAENSADIINLVIVIISSSVILGIVISNLVYRKKLESVKALNDIKEKMTKYRSILIIRYAIIEAPSYLAIAAAMFTFDPVFLIIAATTIVYMIFKRPTKEAIIEDLGLNQQETEFVGNPDSIIADVTLNK